MTKQLIFTGQLHPGQKLFKKNLKTGTIEQVDLSDKYGKWKMGPDLAHRTLEGGVVDNFHHSVTIEPFMEYRTAINLKNATRKFSK